MNKRKDFNRYVSDTLEYAGLFRFWIDAPEHESPYEWVTRYRLLIADIMQSADDSLWDRARRLVQAGKMPTASIKEIVEAARNGRAEMRVQRFCYPENRYQAFNFRAAGIDFLRAAKEYTKLQRLNQKAALVSVEVVAGTLNPEAITTDELEVVMANGIYHYHDTQWLEETEYFPSNIEGIEGRDDDGGVADGALPRYYGDWRPAEGSEGESAVDFNGKYGFAAHETMGFDIAVVWSKRWAIGRPASPSYPGAVDARIEDRPFLNPPMMTAETLFYYALPVEYLRDGDIPF